MASNGDQRVCIMGGCGHVGLPLGLSLASTGLDVELFDVDQAAVDLVNSGIMPFMDEGADELLREVVGSGLTATSERESLTRSDVVVVSLGTPVDEHLNPEVHDLLAILEELIRGPMRDGQLLVLRSTVYPGTSQLVQDRLDDSGKRIDLVFCPERIAQGSSLKEIWELPQIIASFNDRAFERAASLFGAVAPEVVRAEPLEAELAKLFTNAWRYIEFATANQFYMIAESYGLDFYRIYDVLTHNYKRAAGYPTPGFAAGPCLFKDTMQLAAFHSNAFFLGHAAMLVNEGLPDFLVRQLKARVTLRRWRVGVLGMAFKGDSDDPRESLSYKLRKLLTAEGAEVLCTDPYIDDPSFLSLDEVLASAQTIIVAAPHARYRTLDLEGRDIVDPWGVAATTRSLGRKRVAHGD